MKERKHGWVDKAAPYKAWRYHWDHGGVHDVDQVEWRDGQPLAVLELTTADEITDDIKASVAYRLWHQFSGKKLRYLAQRMKVPFYVVLFTPDIDQFAVNHLSQEDAPWVDYSPSEYRLWLSSLPLPSTGTAAATTTNLQALIDDLCDECWTRINADSNLLQGIGL
jgi:hypothetical protein